MHSKSFGRNLTFISEQVFALNCWLVSESCLVLSWSLMSAAGPLSFTWRAPSVAVSCSFNVLAVSFCSSSRNTRPLKHRSKSDPKVEAPHLQSFGRNLPFISEQVFALNFWMVLGSSDWHWGDCRVDQWWWAGLLRNSHSLPLTKPPVAQCD